MITVAPVYAFGTLTSDATIPTANDTVTIGSVTYTFKASVTTTANEVDLGATAAEALENLKAAVNAGAGAGTLYGSLTVANPDVVATTLTATTLKLVSRVPGTVGNFIPTTEAGSHTSFGAAVLGGGTLSVATVIAQLLAGAQLNSEVVQALKEIDGDSTAD